MPPDDLIRARLRARKKAVAAVWRPPALNAFRPWRLVLAFDATLSHTGWVLFVAGHFRIYVLDKGMINPRTELRSYHETWDKARQVRDALRDIPAVYRRDDLPVISSPYAVVVIEAPLAASVGSRPESSLIAGMLIKWHYEQTNPVAVVSATHVAAELLGNARIVSAARKTAIRDFIISVCPEASGRGWNEHQRDALATGLTHLLDEQRYIIQAPDYSVADTGPLAGIRAPIEEGNQ